MEGLVESGRVPDGGEEGGSAEVVVRMARRCKAEGGWGEHSCDCWVGWGW